MSVREQEHLEPSKARQVWSSLEAKTRQEVVAEFHRVIKEMIDEHFRISTAASPGSMSWYTYREMPDSVYNARSEEFAKQGFVEVWHHQFADVNGHTLHSAVWEKTAPTDKSTDDGSSTPADRPLLVDDENQND